MQKNACDQIAEWERDGLGQLRVAVNLSARQLPDLALSSIVESALISSGMTPERLELELTETLMMSDVVLTQKTLEELKQRGVQIAIDDFGTGYSSLTYLKRLPLDEIKIDKSFVTDLLNDPGDRAIIRSILSLAKSLLLNVTAEGIELPEQRDFLAQEGCGTFQGYLYGRPTAIDEFNLFIQEFSAASNAH